MKLTAEQCETLDREGYLFLPDLFSAAEAAVLRSALPAVFARKGPEIVRERNGAVRTAFGVHTYSDIYWRLSRHPRLAEPAMQVLGGPVYIHQFKVNAKAAFDGDVWQWHQDYGTWSRDDLMPEPRAMNLAVFLDPVNEFNGPLMFIPRSHRRGRIEAGHDINTTSYPLWTVDNETIERLVAEGGNRRAQGRARCCVALPLQSGAWFCAQHVAVGPARGLFLGQSGGQRDPPLPAAGVHRAPGLHPD